MEWRIDTGMYGEVKAEALRKVLEASRDHWLKTQTEEAGNAIVRAATGNSGKSGHEQLDATQLAILGEKAKLASKAFADKAATLDEHMEHGIEAACKLAEVFGGLVSATIVGHWDERHPSSCAKRMSVHVDQTWDE